MCDEEKRGWGEESSSALSAADRGCRPPPPLIPLILDINFPPVFSREAEYGGGKGECPPHPRSRTRFSYLRVRRNGQVIPSPPTSLPLPLHPEESLAQYSPRSPPRLRSRSSGTGSRKKPGRGFSSPARLAQRVGRGDRRRKGGGKDGEGVATGAVPHRAATWLPPPLRPDISHPPPPHTHQTAAGWGGTRYFGRPLLLHAPAQQGSRPGPACPHRLRDRQGLAGLEPKEAGIGSGAYPPRHECHDTSGAVPGTQVGWRLGRPSPFPCLASPPPASSRCYY